MFAVGVLWMQPSTESSNFIFNNVENEFGIAQWPYGRAAENSAGFTSSEQTIRSPDSNPEDPGPSISNPFSCPSVQKLRQDGIPGSLLIQRSPNSRVPGGTELGRGLRL